jgi:hypothetical protein
VTASAPQAPYFLPPISYSLPPLPPQTCAGSGVFHWPKGAAASRRGHSWARRLRSLHTCAAKRWASGLCNRATSEPVTGSTARSGRLRHLARYGNPVSTADVQRDQSCRRHPSVFYPQGLHPYSPPPILSSSLQSTFQGMRATRERREPSAFLAGPHRKMQEEGGPGPNAYPGAAGLDRKKGPAFTLGTCGVVVMYILPCVDWLTPHPLANDASLFARFCCQLQADARGKRRRRPNLGLPPIALSAAGRRGTSGRQPHSWHPGRKNPNATVSRQAKWPPVPLACDAPFPSRTTRCPSPCFLWHPTLTEIPGPRDIRAAEAALLPHAPAFTLGAPHSQLRQDDGVCLCMSQACFRCCAFVSPLRVHACL